MITAGTIGAGVVLALAGPIHIGAGTTGVGAATVTVGTDGIDGTTGVGVVTTVVSTTGDGIDGTTGDGTGIMAIKDMPLTEEDEAITIITRWHVIAAALPLEGVRT